MTASSQVEQGQHVEQGRRVEPKPSTKPVGSVSQGVGSTLRLDRWSIRPFLIAFGLLGFIAYATVSAVFGIPYFGFPYEAEGYHSPFFGIALGETVLPAWFSPAILVLWIQVLFRATCYYFRGAYYKAFFLDPPACAVGEPAVHRRFAMENKLPFILMNGHRFALYIAFIPMTVLWWDLVLSMSFEGHFRLGLGVFLVGIDALLLTLYVASCHSFRHLVGGSVDCYSCSRYTQTRHGIWRRVSRLNIHHGKFGWASLLSVIVVDLYVRALAMGVIDSSTPVIGGFL